MTEAARFFFVFEITRKVFYGIIVSLSGNSPVAQVCFAFAV